MLAVTQVKHLSLYNLSPHCPFRIIAKDYKFARPNPLLTCSFLSLLLAIVLYNMDSLKDCAVQTALKPRG